MVSANEIKEKINYERSRVLMPVAPSFKEITKMLIDCGVDMVDIHLPYSTFHCKGNVSEVFDEVKNARHLRGTAKTMFYGDTPVTGENYLPFLSYPDRFWADSVSFEPDGTCIVNLIKGQSAETYMV